MKIQNFEILDVKPRMKEVSDWGLLKYKIPSLWEKTMGEGINVYVLDTGGATDHPDLQENYIGGENFTKSKTALDLNGHSSHCAGIIAASKNGFGVIGVAPKAKIFFIKVLDDNGYGGSREITNALKLCYEKIGKEDGPDVISMSLGSDFPMGWHTHSLIKKITNKNVPIVCAAGNSGREGVNYPARYPETIAIGAYDSDGKLANFSTTGREIDFAAPGVDIYSTWTRGKYAKISGTSMATPFVAGIIALLLSKHKKQEKEGGFNDCKTVEQIKAHLIKHSIDKGPIGKDKKWGYGIINAENLF